MVKVEVDATPVKGRTVQTKRGPQEFFEQTVYVHLLEEDGKPAKYPVKAVVPLKSGAAPYAPGEYTIDERSFIVGDFQQIGLGRVVLVPITAARQQPRAA